MLQPCCTTAIVAWSATPTNSNSKIDIEYSLAIKEKLAEKRKLRKLWQINKFPILKNKLNRDIKALKNLLYIWKEIRDRRISKQVKPCS